MGIMRNSPKTVFGLLLLLLSGSGVLGQAFTNLGDYPPCAFDCIIDAFRAKHCSPTDRACICTSEVFQSNVTGCVILSCPITEALVTKNISMSSCDAPVRDRSHQLLVTTISVKCIADFFVILRFMYRAFGMGGDYGADDWFCLSTVVAGTPMVVIIAKGLIPNGLGRDIWTVPPAQITKTVKSFYMMAWLYFLNTALVKLAFVTFYMRIFPSQGVRRLLWGTLIFISLWGFTFILVSIFQCRPISHFWHMWDGLHEGSCIDINALSWCNAAINIALDIWILIIPLWQLRKLHLKWKKKIPIGLMFSLGAFVTIVSILRLQSLVNFGSHANVTWDFYDVSLWSTIELGVGVIIACLPTVRIFVIKLFPKLGSLGSRPTENYQYATGGQLDVIRPKRNEFGTAGRERLDSESDTPNPSSPRSQKSPVVYYGENDELGLVPGQDIELDSPPKTWQRTSS
jgi:hypothetical protein